MAKLLQKPYWPRLSIEDQAHMSVSQSILKVQAEIKKRDREFEQLWESHERAQAAGEMEGQIYSYPVADGAAYYIVTKAKPLTLRWLNVGDCWQVPDALIRGLRVADIDLVERR